MTGEINMSYPIVVIILIFIIFLISRYTKKEVNPIYPILGLFILIFVVIIILYISHPRINDDAPTRNLSSDKIRFNNSDDHDIDRTNSYTVIRDLTRNLLFSTFNYIFNPQSSPEMTQIENEFINHGIECGRLSADDEYYNVVYNDYFMKDDFSATINNDGTGFRDHVSCIRNSGGRAEWRYDKKYEGERCFCKKSYGGCSCEIELYDDKYVSVADEKDIDKFDMFSHDKVYVDKISFAENGEISCSGLCDEDESCSGFVLTDNNENTTDPKYICMLLENNIVPTSTDIIPITPLGITEPSVYLKNYDGLARPRFKDRIIVGQGNNVLRPWAKDVHEGGITNIVSVFVDRVKYVNFIPEYIINDTGNEDNSTVNYGNSKVLVVSSLPILESTISNKRQFSNSSTMKIIRDVGYVKNIGIPKSWNEVYCLLTEL